MPVIMTPWRDSAAVSALPATNVALFQPDVPSDLPAAVQAHYEQLSSELAPQSHLERIFIQEIARHAAAVDLAHTCETTILETSGRQASLLAGSVPADDAQCIAAVGSPALLRLGVYYGRHARALAA